MRRYISTIMIVALILCLTGCGGETGSTGMPAAEATTQAAEEATTEAMSYDEVYVNIESYVNDSLKNTSNKTIKQDENGNILLVVAYSDGTETAKAAKEGDSESTQTWQKASGCWRIWSKGLRINMEQ